MAEDLDVEAMLEAPYNRDDPKEHERGPGEEKELKNGRKKRSHSRSRSRERKRDKDRGKDRKERDYRDRKRERSRSRDKDRRDKDRDHDRDRDREKDRMRERERRERERRDRDRDRERRNRDKKGRSRSRERTKTSKSPTRKLPVIEMTPEERDARTVFCMQLAARIRPRDLEEFFSSVGKVREVKMVTDIKNRRSQRVMDVRLITDNKTRKSKGVAYVEFSDVETVPLAIGLTGQKLLGVPIMVQASQAEKNRIGQATTNPLLKFQGPMRLYVGSLHYNITEDMLRGIFEPFGKIQEIKLIVDHETNRSQGYGFITFHNAEDAQKALQQLNGFELAGRPIKVGHVTDRTIEAAVAGRALDTDELDRAGVDLGATGRLQLMAKLAEGTGFQIPQAAANALNMGNNSPSSAMSAGIGASAATMASAAVAAPITTQCFMLSNMFDPSTESNPNWDVEIKDDVVEECNKHGGLLHIYVDKTSQGNVYVKCPSIAAAVASVTALHGRWFAGKMITAAYVPLPNYHQLFPDAQRSSQLLLHSAKLTQYAGLPAGFSLPQ